MRTLRNLMLASLLLVGNLTYSQNLKEVVKKHLDALGGEEKLKSIKTIRMEGNLSVMGQDIPIIMTQVHELGRRVDISAMGMDGYVILTKTAGWQYMPFTGQTAAEPMPEAVVKQSSNDYDLQSPLIDFASKGNTVELLGKESIQGLEYYKIKIVTKNGKPTTYLINPDTYMIDKAIVVAEVEGQATEQTVDYRDYKKTAEGFVFPHSMSGAFGQGDLLFTKIEVNKPVDEKIFKVE